MVRLAINNLRQKLIAEFLPTAQVVAWIYCLTLIIKLVCLIAQAGLDHLEWVFWSSNPNRAGAILYPIMICLESLTPSHFP